MTFIPNDTLSVKWGESLIGVINFKGGSDMLQRSLAKAFPELQQPPDVSSMAAELKLLDTAAAGSISNAEKSDAASSSRGGISDSDDRENADSAPPSD